MHPFPQSRSLAAAPRFGRPAWSGDIASFVIAYAGSIAAAWRAWQRMRRLESMSDAQLAALGLTRAEILATVLDSKPPVRR